MTAQRVLARMEDQRDVAVVAAFGVAALKAEDPRREAAAIEKQDRLSAGCEGLVDRAAKGPRQDQLAAAWVLRLLLREVDDLDGRERSSADAARERQAAEPALLGAVARFEGRCRRAEHERTARVGGAPFGEIAGVVAEALFVLVGPVVLFVDHDEA
jgi:hypothetical protein